MSQDYQDLIDQYLLGRMTDEEKARFEAMLEEDSELREGLQLTRMVSEELKTEAELREKMQRWDEEMDSPKPMQKERLKVHREKGVFMAAPVEDEVLYDMSLNACGSVPEPEPKLAPKKKRRRRWYWLGGIAAVLVVGLVISTFVVGRRGSVSTSTPEPEAALRGSDDLEEIRLLMEAGKWEEALAQIDEDMLEARDGLENVCAVEGEEADYERQECELRLSLLSWLKVQALLELGRRDEALQLLDSLRTSDDVDAPRADSLYLYIKANQ